MWSIRLPPVETGLAPSLAASGDAPGREWRRGKPRLYGKSVATSVRLGFCSQVMGADPGFCLLAGGQDLRPSHLRSQPFKSRFAVLVTLGERDCRPEIGFGQILRNSTARPIVSAERSLRDNLANPSSRDLLFSSPWASAIADQK